MSEQDCNMEEEDFRAEDGLVEKLTSSLECDETKETSSDSDQLERSQAKKTKLSDSPIAQEGNSRFAGKTDFRETNPSLMEINEEEDENHDHEDCVLAELKKVGSCSSSSSSSIRVLEKIVSNEEDNRFSEKTVSRETSTSMSLMENKDKNEENQEKGSCSSVVEAIMPPNADIINEEGDQEIEFDLNLPCPELIREECKYKSKRVEGLYIAGIQNNNEQLGNQEIDVDLNLPCEEVKDASRVEIAGIIHNNEQLGNQEIDDVDLNLPCEEVKYTSRVEELYIDGETKEVVFIDIEDSDDEGNQCDQKKELKNKSEGETEKVPYGGERDGFINNEKRGYSSREEKGKGKIGEDWLTMSLAFGGSLDDHFDNKGK